MDDQRIEEIAKRHSRVSAVKPDMIAAIREALSAQEEELLKVMDANAGLQRHASAKEAEARRLEEELRSLREERHMLRAALSMTEGTPQDIIHAAVAINDGSVDARRILRHVIEQGNRAESAEAELQRLREGMRALREDINAGAPKTALTAHIAERIQCLLASPVEEKVS